MIKNRRRAFDLNWNDKPQRYFVVLEFILMALSLSYLLYLVFGTVDHAVNKLAYAGKPDWDLFFEEITLKLLVRISLLFAVVFLIHILCGLFFLHRITGPLIRTRSVLNQIADGKIPQADVTMRKGDFPTDLAHELSRALRRIRSYQRK